MQIISQRLISAREENGLSQREMAESLGLSHVGYGAFERGRTLPSIDYLMEIARITHKPITYFLGIDNDRLSTDEAELLELYRVLNDDRRRFVLGFARMAVQQDRKLETEE